MLSCELSGSKHECSQKPNVVLLVGRCCGKTASCPKAMLTDTTLDEEDPDDDGLDSFTHEQIRSFSRALGVDFRLVDSELLCYASYKKFQSRTNPPIDRDVLLEAWYAIPKSFKSCPRNPDRAHNGSEPKVILSGASPRSSTILLHGTLTHPHLTRLVNVFIKQQRPHFRYTTFALREDLSRPPHRDVRNGPCGTLFQVLSKGVGGGLWISCKDGPDTREHNGTLVQGLNLTAQDQPIIFDARRLLHASQDWPNNARRVVLIAWTVISVRTLPCRVVQQLTEVGFPVPSTADLSVEIAQDWMPDPSLPATKRLKQTPLVFRRPELQDPGLVLENGAVTHHLD